MQEQVKDKSGIQTRELVVSIVALVVFVLVGLVVGGITRAVLSGSEIAEVLSPAIPEIAFLVIVVAFTGIGVAIVVPMFSTHRGAVALGAQGQYAINMNMALKEGIQAWNLLPPAMRTRYIPPVMQQAMVLMAGNKVVNPDLNDPNKTKWTKLLPPGEGTAVEESVPSVDEDNLFIPDVARKNYVNVVDNRSGIVVESMNDLEARRIALANMVETRCRDSNPSAARITLKLRSTGLIRSNGDITAAQAILEQRGEIYKSGDGRTNRWLWRDTVTGHTLDHGVSKD